MKILFTRFPLASAYGGAEIQTLSLMRGLHEKGHAVGFLGSCQTLIKRSREQHFPVAELTIGPPPVTKWDALSFFWRGPRMRKKLTTALDQFSDLQAVYMLSLSEKLLATEWLHNKGIKVFWVEHDRIGRWLRRNPWLPKLRKLSSLATTITVSDLSKELYGDLGFDTAKTMAIPNGIDLERFAKGKGERAKGKGTRIRVGCVARLSHEKGIDVLIQAVADLPDVSLDIVGTGPEEGYIRNMIDSIANRELQDPPRIRLLPSHSDLGAFYAGLDVLVLPSRDHDPFGLTAAEAMALGLPVIVTDQCGIAGYLANGKDAMIVKADSSEALRKAIEKLQDPEKREAMGEKAKKSAEKKFSLAAMVEAYETLLKN